MVEVTKKVLEYIIIFIIVYVISYVSNIKKRKKYDRKKAPSNIKYLVFKYNIDVVKVGYKRVLKFLYLCDSFIVATLYLITGAIENVYIRLLVAFILVFPFFAGVYHLAGMYFKKKENE